MTNSQAQYETRQHHILDASAALIMRQGYDKTTMGDIAEAVGVSRGIVYLHFENKEKLFEVLIQREIFHYVQAWMAYIESDPRGGTIGGIYRAVLHAINSRPLMAAMMRRDRHIMGGYLRKPGNMFASMQSSSLSIELLPALQAAGTVRKDIDPKLMSHIMDILSYGLLTIQDFKQPDELPPFDAVMETLADMLDCLLMPKDGVNNEAGKAVIRQLAVNTQMLFEQMQQSSEK